MADPTDPDVIASAPRPTVADDPNRHPFWPASDRCRICDRVECRRRELSIAYYRLDDRGKPKRGKDAEWLAALEALAPVADECARLRVDWRAEALGWRAKAATPPTLPADLRGLLDELAEASEAHDSLAARALADASLRNEFAVANVRLMRAASVVAEWHRAHGRHMTDRPRCRCTNEAGDTGDCPAHPTCDECGEPTTVSVRRCVGEVWGTGEPADVATTA